MRCPWDASVPTTVRTDHCHDHGNDHKARPLQRPHGTTIATTTWHDHCRDHRHDHCLERSPDRRAEHIRDGPPKTDSQETRRRLTLVWIRWRCKRTQQPPSSASREWIKSTLASRKTINMSVIETQTFFIKYLYNSVHLSITFTNRLWTTVFANFL